jgi:hypothetical protein
MSQLSRRLSSGLIVLAASLVLTISPLLAKGTLDVLEKFVQPGLELDVATYSNPEKDHVRIIGLIGLAAGAVRNSFAFNADEWATLTGLADKAAKAQSPNGKWTVVGEMTETGTADVSHIVVAAGAGIRFALNSPKGASLTYVVAKGDIGRFQQALGRVKAVITMR